MSSEGFASRYLLATIPPPEKPNPLLWLCRRLLESGFNDACAVGPDGQPTQDAKDGWEWLTCRDTDRVRCPGTAIPDPALRLEHIMSFSWCCHFLNLDVENVRTNGLPKMACSVNANKPMKTRLRKSHWNGYHHVPGLDGIMAARQQGAESKRQRLEKCRAQFGEAPCFRCGAAFVRRNHGQRFCSERCRNANQLEQNHRREQGAALFDVAPGCAAAVPVT